MDPSRRTLVFRAADFIEFAKLYNGQLLMFTRPPRIVDTGDVELELQRSDVDACFAVGAGAL